MASDADTDEISHYHTGSGLVYREDRHHDNCCAKIEELWQARALCDIRVTVEDADGKPSVSIGAHRLVLAANIPYFRAMLTSEMQESSQPEVKLRGVDEEGLKAVIGWAYTGKVEITEKSAQGLLATASMLDLPRIVSACASFIAKHTHPSNCLGIRRFAQLHDLQSLVATASSFALNNFADVALEEEFLDLSVDEVEEFVENDCINVRSEEDVYEAVTRWIRSNREKRAGYGERLYRHVRFPILPVEFLNNVAKHNDILTSSSAGQINIQEALDYHINPASVMLFTNPKKIQPRSSVMGVICVVGGAGDSSQSLNDVTFFSPHEKRWLLGTKMLQHRSRLAVALFHGELYAIGGNDISEPLETVEKYSPKSNSWSSVASMNTARRNCAAVVTPKGIVALGGYSGSVFLKSVELYDADLNEWTFQPAMISGRSDVCAVFLDRRIYAIGGLNTTGQLCSVEQFDLLNRKWEMVADMFAPRANAAAALLGQEIFVAGGQAEKEVINSAEVYTPELNQWEQLSARMMSPRVGLAMVSMGNMIYVIGGSDGSEYLDSVECYDPSRMKWVPMPKLPAPRFGAAAIALSKRDYIAS